ncbi:accessory Sec system S-layer assembly protein [Jeotgalibacillus sp. JSM ZJ347]|uniref:accessory Sec system S-layer assembly protein n=1 Tax=Jeotgalibacillus sp. JSM ZJ347 TaxID=3342117 RepID=UPI0035A8E858
MSIFSIFSKQKKDMTKSGRDSAVASDQLTGGKNQSSADREVTTKLSFHPEWTVEKEKEYVYRFLNNDLAPLKPNQLSLSGIDIERNERNGDLHVTAFVRQSLAKPINLKKTDLVLLDQNEQVIAKKQFDLSELGQLPAESSRPWIFIFDKASQTETEIPEQDWQLSFLLNAGSEHRLDFDPAWEKSLDDQQKQAIETLYKRLPELKKDQVNLTGIQQKLDAEGNLQVDVFIRNTYEKELSFEQIPLLVQNEEKEIVAQGTFKLDQFKVKANSTKPWRFIYPASTLKDYQPDKMKSWNVQVVQSADKI